MKGWRIPSVILSCIVLAWSLPIVGNASRVMEAGKNKTRAAATVTPDGNMARSAIPDLYKWNLKPLFKSDKAWEDALQKATGAVDRLGSFKGKLAKPSALESCLKIYFDTRLLVNKLTLYANMRFDSEQKSSTLRSMNARAQDAMQSFMSGSSFIRQEVLAIDDATLAKAYGNNRQLGIYRPYIEEIRRRRSRVQSPETERVLSLMGDNLWAEIDLNEIPSDHEKTFGALLTDIPLPTIKDEAGKGVQLTLSNYGKYRGSSDRRVRKETVESFFKTLRQYENALAGTLEGQVRYNVSLARARGYDTALEAYLDKDNISPKVYKNLISTIRKNLTPLRRYITLRKRVMKVDELHIYDLYTPLVESVNMEFSYPDAQRVLAAALAPLGEDYLKVLNEGLDPKNGWIDVYPHADKESGAFSSSVFGIHPYVKMNYYNEVGDLSTLAHEYGHALHSHLSMNNQPYVTANYVPFIAEIASTFNEKLLSDYLYANAKSDAEKLYILNELVETIRTTIYRQTLFAEFELKIHTAAEEGTPLTAEFLNQTYGDLIRTYYGKDFTVGENDAIEWAYIPHFYYKYYVFTYASGLASGIALAERVGEVGDEARDAYLEMLKGGCSQPPLKLLEEAGVDLTSPQAIQAAARLLDVTLKKMESLLK